MTKSYSELITIDSYIERYRYLRIGGKAGEITFGNERYLNQILYKSDEWKMFRNKIIVRDSYLTNHCYDMGFRGADIGGIIIVHHINPITVEDILQRRPCVFDPENVICVSHNTHEAIHYGNERLLTNVMYVERMPNDTAPWRMNQ
jgi:hypothetical protein